MLNQFIKKLISISKNIISLIVPFFIQAQEANSIEIALKKSGANRPEIQKALNYANQTGDPLKIKAMNFLITNMDIHYSSDYFWENALKQKVDYNELDFADFKKAEVAFNEIKEKNHGLHPKIKISNDIETVSSEFLIQNLESAFLAWNSSSVKNISFEYFCEYILPYRVSEEPIQNWREVYKDKFKWVNNEINSKGFKSVLFYLKDDYDTWFTNTWGSQRKEPLPNLGGLQLLFRKQGPCIDIADLGVFTMRSQGIPAALDLVPFWATSTGGHYMNTFFGNDMKPYNCDYGSKDFGEGLKREPAKVIRLTYSKHPETLASLIIKSNIPKGFLQLQNYIDVTSEYWDTTNAECKLFPSNNENEIVYATTFNGLIWKPFWWGKAKKGNVVFSSICKNTIILPQYYNNGKLTPAGPPVIVNENNQQNLLPDLTNTRTVNITEADKFLKFKLGVTYKLFYWDNTWKLLEAKEVDASKSLIAYEKVPKNALLLLIGSDTKSLERPFIMDDNGNRTWF